MSLYQHKPHPHQPRNVNQTHARENLQRFNTRLAVLLTKSTGTMWTAYLFAILGVIGLLGLLNLLNPFVFLLTTWLSQQFLQLVLLPVIMVGQNVLSKHSELQADEAFQTTMHTFHDTEQMIEHLNAQDRQIIAIDTKILQILERLESLQKAREHSS